MPSTLGSVTKSVFEHLPEAHKLHLEFTVAAAQAVRKGDPVVLAANGNVQAAASAAPGYTVIGVSLHDGAAGEFVTIAMKGYCVVNAEAAAASLNAGAVQLGAWNGTTLLREYAVAAGADDQVKDTVAIGHNLTQAVADGDAIKVCLTL
jgi:hypothetical protein